MNAFDVLRMEIMVLMSIETAFYVASFVSLVHMKTMYLAFLASKEGSYLIIVVFHVVSPAKRASIPQLTAQAVLKENLFSDTLDIHNADYVLFFVQNVHPLPILIIRSAPSVAMKDNFTRATLKDAEKYVEIHTQSIMFVIMRL